MVTPSTRVNVRLWIVFGLFALALVLRLHNAWVLPPLSGFDGPFHGTYLGILHFEGRLPLPDESWSTFHPPLYYALCALLWGGLPDALSPHAVLFALRLVNVFAGLGIGLAAWACACRLFPTRPDVPVYAALLTLFLPMHIGPAGALGNELLAAALGSAALLAFLYWLPFGDGPRRSAAVGLMVGLAILTKISALALLAALALVASVRGVQRLGVRPAAVAAPAVIVLVAILVSGFYFGRNIALYDTPIVMQTEVVTDVMKRQGYGPTRPLRGFTSMRTDVLLHPATRSAAARSAVLPMTFASVWFDVRGTTLHVADPWARRAAHVLFVCGALITALLIAGALALGSGRVGSAVPLGAATLIAVAGFSLAAYGGFTYRVATATALKGTYLSPAVVPFALFASVGADVLARRAGWMRAGIAALLGVLVATVTAIFWTGWLAPIRIEPAAFYVRHYTDAPTKRVYEYFVGPWPEDAATIALPGGSR